MKKIFGMLLSALVAVLVSTPDATAADNENLVVLSDASDDVLATNVIMPSVSIELTHPSEVVYIESVALITNSVEISSLDENDVGWNSINPNIYLNLNSKANSTTYSDLPLLVPLLSVTKSDSYKNNNSTTYNDLPLLVPLS